MRPLGSAVTGAAVTEAAVTEAAVTEAVAGAAVTEAAVTEAAVTEAAVTEAVAGAAVTEAAVAGTAVTVAAAAQAAVTARFTLYGMGGDAAGQAGPDERYACLVEELASVAGVSGPREGGGFGRGALRFQNKIFAMLVRGRLVVKLPAERVDALIAAGDGVRYDANKGTPMKEWFSLDPQASRPWLPLAREALDFVRSGSR